MASNDHTFLVLFVLVSLAQAVKHKFWLEPEVPFRPGVRSYKNYAIDRSTGFLQPVRATVEIVDKTKMHTEQRLVGPTHDFTTFEAVPLSLEQFLRPYGHALLDTAWDINEIAPVVHLHMLWMEETNGAISLPCWSPAQQLPIKYNQTTMRGHKRTWLLGQGHTFSLSLVSAFGYRKEPSSEALLVSPFKGLQAGHAVFTCMLSRKRPSDDKFSPRLSFIQTHMIYYQTSEEALQTARGKVEVELELVAFTPESHGPPCQLYPNEYNQAVCREAAWQQIRSMDVRSRNAGYRYYKNPRLASSAKKQLKRDLSSTITDFCRLYSCTGEVVLESVEPKYTNVSVPEILHFFGDHVKHPNQSIIVVPPVWETPNSPDTRDTYQPPGDTILRIKANLKFTNGMINCHMVTQLFEPDMGDLQQTAHFMALDEEPYNPLARMLTPYEMTWIREREIPDAVKYRPTFCADSSIRQDTFGGVNTPAYNLSAGYTVIVSLPTEADLRFAELLFADDRGSGDCDLGIRCTSELCKLQISREGSIMEMNIPDYPSEGLYKPIEEPPNTGRLNLILIVGSFEKTRNLVYQPIITLRNSIRVADGALPLDPNRKEFRNCGTRATIEMSDNTWLKILNWPAYELIGPSVERAKEAYEHLILPCNQSFSGIPYSASGQPLPLTVQPNYERRIYFSRTGALCSQECELSRQDMLDGMLALTCPTAGDPEPCMKHYYVSIRRDIYELVKMSLNWRYSAFAVQFCGSDYERISEDTPYTIATGEALACMLSRQVQSLSHILVCQLQQSMEDLQHELGPRCRFFSKDDDLIHRYPVNAAKMKLVPVVKKCEPKMEARQLFDSYQRPPDHLVQRLNYHERTCPIGYRRAKALDSYMCIRCPPDSYADLDTELTSCQGCPLARPSTYSGGAASSAMCSNDQLNKLRGLFFRYDMNNLSDDEWDRSFNLSSQMWWNRKHVKLESLDHLKPEAKYLEQQRQAVALFKAMTQLTFSNTEVFLMIVIATSLAVFGGVNFLLILTATSKPTRCPASDFYGPDPNWKERIGLAIYCALCKIAMMIGSIVIRIRRRIRKEYTRVRKSMQSARLSTATSTISRKFSNLVRKRYEQNRLPPLTEGQKNLVHLLTKTTIDRIVEAAERDLAKKRERERLIVEEQLRRRHEAGEVEVEAREAELAAEAAQREADAAEQQLKDAKDGRARTAAQQRANQARMRAEKLQAEATSMRELAARRLSALKEITPLSQIMEQEKDLPSLTQHDKIAVENASKELRPYLSLPRFHTPEFFLLHPDMQRQAEMRTTIYPAPERDRPQNG